MRVLIDTTFARRGPGGTAVYVDRLMEALQPLGVEVVEAANPHRRAPGGGAARSAANLAADRRWELLELPRRAREANVDVVHHPLPAIARTTIPQVVTVHDLAFERLPEHFDAGFRRWASHAHRRAARRAAAVVAVSETTARDAMARWGVAPERIVVARHGPGQAAAPADPSPAPPAGREPRHFLYVGDDEPRKDLATLREAHRLAPVLPLVVAGSAGEPASPEQLAALYAGAAALVHPALYEGFGLTALEAMAAGTPVVAARSPGLAETCGDAALYVTPGDPIALAQALRRVAAEPDLRAELRRKGFARVTQFSWASSARAHVNAYTLALR